MSERGAFMWEVARKKPSSEGVGEEEGGVGEWRSGRSGGGEEELEGGRGEGEAKARRPAAGKRRVSARAGEREGRVRGRVAEVMRMLCMEMDMERRSHSVRKVLPVPAPPKMSTIGPIMEAKTRMRKGSVRVEK